MESASEKFEDRFI